MKDVYPVNSQRFWIHFRKRIHLDQYSCHVQSNYLLFRKKLEVKGKNVL